MPVSDIVTRMLARLGRSGSDRSVVLHLPAVMASVKLHVERPLLHIEEALLVFGALMVRNVFAPQSELETPISSGKLGRQLFRYFALPDYAPV